MSKEQVAILIDNLLYYWNKYFPDFGVDTQVYLDGIYAKYESYLDRENSLFF